MENDMVDSECSLHQKPREVWDTEAVMDTEGSLHQKPRDVCAIEEVMNDEGSLHQKTTEVCITEDAEPTDLEWFENTKLNRVKNGTQCLLQVGCQLARLRQEFNEGLVKQWQKSWMPKLKGEMKFILPEDHQWRNESLHTSRPRSNHRISILTSMNFFGQVRILLLLQFSGTVR